MNQQSKEIVNSINTYNEYYIFLDKVRSSNTHKRGWFVYTERFNEGDAKLEEYMIGDNLTEEEAQKLYEANKFAVENCGYDYANIYIENLYEPHAHVYVYNRIKGKDNVRASQLQDIYNQIFKKIN